MLYNAGLSRTVVAVARVRAVVASIEDCVLGRPYMRWGDGEMMLRESIDCPYSI